eukprot:375471-Prorocentrum_minimum.AAC.4
MEQVWTWLSAVAEGEAPGLLWRIFEYCSESLLGAVRHLLDQAARERVLVLQPEALSRCLESAKALLDRILPAAECWFEEPGGTGPLPGHGLRSREALRLQSLRVKESEALLDALRAEGVDFGVTWRRVYTPEDEVAYAHDDLPRGPLTLGPIGMQKEKATTKSQHWRRSVTRKQASWLLR